MTAVAEPVTDDRTPPNDRNAEQCVLGGMLMSKDAIPEAIEIVRADAFYYREHQVIFEAITALYSAGEPADATTVAARLADNGELSRAGGGPYLQTCMNATPTAASTRYYARIVRNRAQRRDVIAAGIKIQQIGFSHPGTAEEIADLAHQTVFDITEGGSRNGPAPFSQLIQETLDGIEAAEAQGRSGALRGVPTGFLDLDKLTSGLQGGQLILVAGRPGQGKSTLSLDMARHAAFRRNIPTAIFNLEMSSSEIMLRLLSAECRIPLTTLRDGTLSDDQWTVLARRIAEIAEAPIFIDDNPNMTLLEITAKARRLHQQHGIRQIQLDYLGLLSSPGNAESRQQEVSAISRGLKLLAKELNIPVIAVCQLNRGPEQRSDKRPQLSDLRESGSLEQDADMVIFVHRDDYYDKESTRAGEADIIVAKHRNGPTDTITVAAQLHFSRFVDMAIG